MRNLVEEYLENKHLNMSDFARMLKAEPSSVYGWKHRKTIPHPKTAWKIHKLTKGEIPLQYWGYTFINGKIKKLAREPLDGAL